MKIKIPHIPFLKKRKIDSNPMSNFATRDDILKMERELIEYKKRVILASLSPRQRARLQKMIDERNPKHEKE